MPAEYLDVSTLFNQELINWRELWGSAKSPGEGLINLLNKTLWVPNAEVQIPVLAAYMMINAKWATCAPVCFGYGPPGTGKSTAAMVNAEMHDVPVQSSSSTYASIRNAIKTARYLNPDDEEKEADGALLAWDNINSETLSDGDILNILLAGYKRGPDLITISSIVAGTNITFRCFCPKMISSVHPLFNKYELRELKRRLLIIFHEKCKGESLEIVDIDEVDWTDFYLDGYWPLWQSAIDFKMYKSNWLKAKRLVYSSPAWDDNRKSLCRDLIATGVMMGIWENNSEAIAALGVYWEYFDKRVGGNAGELDQFFKQWIEEKAAARGTPVTAFAHSELSAQIDLWVGNKQLIGKPKKAEIEDAMNTLGFKKELANWVIT